MEVCLLGSRPIDPKQRIRIFKHRDETEVSIILQKSSEMTFFSDVLVVCISAVCVFKRVSRKGKKLNTFKAATPKSENAVSI